MPAPDDPQSGPKRSQTPDVKKGLRGAASSQSGADIEAAMVAFCTSCPNPSLEPGTQDEVEVCTPLLFSDSAMTGSECDLKEQLAAAALPLDYPTLLKRRAAKRDSARRVRAKKQDLLNSLACEMDELTASNSRLVEDSIEVDNDVTRLSAHLSATRTRILHTTTLSEQLTQELQMLQRMSAGLTYQTEHLACIQQSAPALLR